MTEFSTSRRNAYIPLPDYIAGGLHNQSEMLASLHEEYHAWTTDRIYGEVGAGTRDQRVLEGAYAVVRNIGDGELASINSDVGAILQGAGYGYNLKITNSTETHGRAASVRTHNHRHGINQGDTLTIDLALIADQQAPLIQEKLRRNELHMPLEHVAYLMTLRTVAHESAHVIQSSIGKLAGSGGADAVNFMGSLFTEVSGVNPDVLNEGFAEGYAEIVLTRSLQELGYSESDQAAILRAMSHRGNDAAIAKGYDPVPKEGVVHMLEYTMQHIRSRADEDW